MPRSFWVETLGCPKNQVDSDKLTGAMLTDGMIVADSAEDADLVVVNTCAFIEEAREESVATILALDETRSGQSRLVVTGCMAERYGDELAAALPEVDQVVGFGAPGAVGRAGAVDTRGAAGVPVTIGSKPTQGKAQSDTAAMPAMDLLNMARPASLLPWAYVKVAEGCDKSCGFCAIPSFRGPQRSRSVESILDEVDQLDVNEIVLIAQDLAAYGRDQGVGQKSIVKLVEAVAERADWVRLLYLYPSELTDDLIGLMGRGPVPYFDLSLQHVSAPLVRRMRRWGNGEKYLERIERIRQMRPDATFRSNFIVGYPGETEADHDELLEFVEAAQLDWCGFFSYSQEAGTYAADLDGQVDPALMADRLAELREMQDEITARRRDELIGTRTRVLVDSPGVARSHREAPEIDGIINVPTDLRVGQFHEVLITGAEGPDLFAEALVSGSGDSRESSGGD
ncbi:MAG: 30S ribosomal protein S12 methylthiotransferase RimO [Microthrixaceae bacterium]